MARGGIRFSQMYVGVDRFTQRVAREAATKVVKKLATISPYYSGEFADNWVVEAGNKPIPPTTPGTEPRPKERQPRKAPVLPVVPSLYGTSVNEYSIGNTMEYRDIAMDLVPGRVERARTISAPQDWYRTYLRTQLRDDVRSVLDNMNDIRDFIPPRPVRIIGPVGRQTR